MQTVVTFTTSDRLPYAIRTLRSWRDVRGIEDALLVFSCEPCEPMVKLVRSVDFAETIVTVNDQRLGNEVNSYKALAAGFETGADFVIQAEDDVLVAADVLEYLTWGAETYAADESVLTISGYQNAVLGAQDELFRRQWFTACIWGIWRDRWEKVKDRWPGGPTPHSWDWYLCERMKASGQVAIEPCVTRGQHIGVTGAHGSHPEHLVAEWDAQKFVAEIGLQEYREIARPVAGSGE